MKFRPAKENDIPAAAAVVVAALSAEAPWKAFASKGSTAACEAYLQGYLAADDVLFLVVEVAHGIGAVAVWDLTGTGVSRAPKPPPEIAPLHDAVSRACKTQFGQEACVVLHLLATRPDLQGKGYGKALCAAGVDAARARHASVGVLAASRGYVLFSGLGFVDTGAVEVAAGDETPVKAMVLGAAVVQRRRSLWDSLVKYVTT